MQSGDLETIDVLAADCAAAAAVVCIAPADQRATPQVLTGMLGSYGLRDGAGDGPEASESPPPVAAGAPDVRRARQCPFMFFVLAPRCAGWAALGSRHE